MLRIKFALRISHYNRRLRFCPGEDLNRRANKRCCFTRSGCTDDERMDRIFQYNIYIAFIFFRIDWYAICHFIQTAERCNSKSGVCRYFPLIHKMRVFEVCIYFKYALAAAHTHVDDNNSYSYCYQRNPDYI